MATFEIIGASSGGGGSPAGYAAGYPDGTKMYVALLSQTGTDAPVATVLMNTLGGTVVWTYSSTGNYLATLAGAFPETKTSVITQFLLGSDCGFGSGSFTIGALKRLTDDTVGLYTTDDSFVNSANGILTTPVTVQILVFP